MNSTLTLGSSFFNKLNLPTNQRPFTLKTHNKPFILKAKTNDNNNNNNPFIRSTTIALVFSAIALSKFPPFAFAHTPQTIITENQESETESVTETEKEPALTKLLEANPEAIDTLKTLLQEKLEAGEDDESFEILEKLSSAQPNEPEWKFLKARLLNEMGRVQESREVFEEILSKNPLSFEALFENALLMDRCGEGVKVTQRLEEALKIAEEENKVKEGRDVRFIMAQVQFLQKNVEEALRCYEELEREDPKDFRTYFCKGMIYSLMDRNKEAKEQFAKYRELSPRKFEVEGYLRTPLSRMKLFGTDEN